ncbi:MAG: hypothetical protein NZM26_01800 [Patescibacteria group bacterium]|nr:hypothetical protein [Patescibacteria group bacterium]
MSQAGNVKKLVQIQNQQNYGDDTPIDDSGESTDIDELAEEILGNVVPEDQPLDIASEIENDEQARRGPPEDNIEEDIVDPASIKPIGEE